MMKKITIICIVLVWVLQMLPDYVLADPNTKKNSVELHARAAILIDGDTGRVLYEQNAYEEYAMASTTKIMTLLVVLEYGNIDDEVEFSKKAASMPKVHLGAKQGDKFKLSDLCYALMLESYNDAAVAIAEHIGGSVEGFAKLMNQKARDLGLYHTHFVTPNGLDAKDHKTTAFELAQIARYAMKNDKFVEIVNTKEKNIVETDTGKSYHLFNRNAFLNTYEGANGVKTGFTGDAGYCFVGSAQRENKKFVVVLLGCGWPPHKTYKWQDTRKLMDYAFREYDWKVVSKDIEKKVTIKNGIESDSAKLIADEQILMLVSDQDKVSIQYSFPEEVSAPIHKNEKAGWYTIYINEKPIRTVNAYFNCSIKKINYQYIIKKLAEKYFLCQ